MKSKIRTEERALRAYQHRESLLHLGAMSVSQVGAAVQYALAEGDADSLGLLLMELGRRVGLDVSVRRHSGRAEGVETDSFMAATAPFCLVGTPHAVNSSTLSTPLSASAPISEMPGISRTAQRCRSRF